MRRVLGSAQVFLLVRAAAVAGAGAVAGAVAGAAAPVLLDNAGTLTTVAGPWSTRSAAASGGFDFPALALRVNASATAVYTGHSEVDLFSLGATVDAQLSPPRPTGLAPDASNLSFAHCGRWLNAGLPDPADAAVVHGFVHQEWDCDYAEALYTNKSVAYAVSHDGGQTFSADASAQLIASGNTTSAHQTGEGDHGTVVVGDAIYMFFVEWDAAPDNARGVSSGLARSALADRGRPGTWTKLFRGAFSEPGVGGRADWVRVSGTAVQTVPEISASTVVSVGLIFTRTGLGFGVDISWSDGVVPPTNVTPAAAGPLFNADYSDFNRGPRSNELFIYPSLVGPEGSSATQGVPTASSFLYISYLPFGAGFDELWLVRRGVQILRAASGTRRAPPALAALSLWQASSPAGLLRAWPTTLPVTPGSAPPQLPYALARDVLCHLVTWHAAPALVALKECARDEGVVVLAVSGECGAGELANFTTQLRSPGWAAATAADAAALGWADVERPSDGVHLAADVGELWRCRGAGADNFSASFGDATCASAGAGFAPDRRLGFALGPLRAR